MARTDPVPHGIDKASVDPSQRRKIQPVDRRPLEHGFDDTASNNRLIHPEQRFSREGNMVAQAKEVHPIQRNRLRIEIEDGVGMSKTLRSTRLLSSFWSLTRRRERDRDWPIFQVRRGAPLSYTHPRATPTERPLLCGGDGR
jgi:hypothetical protein